MEGLAKGVQHAGYECDYHVQGGSYLYLDKKEQIKSYWTKRSKDFAALRAAELGSSMAGIWMAEILPYLPRKEKLQILDIGTGGGFFAILLSEWGHEVTGIDLTPSMILEAERIAADAKSNAKFLVMDAENLDFMDDSFDMVITRNLTWTLPNAKRAYEEWNRVLKTGGVLLNFDGNYGKDTFAKKEEELPVNHAHNLISQNLMQECDRLKSQLDISYLARPAWDVEVLGELGFTRIQLDLGISSRIYKEKNEFYNPTPMFSICAVK